LEAPDIAEEVKVREVLVAFASGDVRFCMFTTGVVVRMDVDDDEENRADAFDRQGTRDVRGVLMFAVIDRREMVEEDILVDIRVWI
jgi:hypothetical protein